MNKILPNPDYPNTMDLLKIRYVDLFCGLGAFHLAFDMSDHFQCVFACDINKEVRAIYESNHHLVPHKDIKSIDPSLIPDFEILCAGFPCQSFSIAGNGLGFQDEEVGNLFYDILRVIDVKTPELCILENVKNLMTHKKGRTYSIIRSSLEERGYQVVSKVLNAANFGSPQARERIFIIASRKPFEIPEVKLPMKSVSDIIDFTIESELDLTNYELRPKSTTLRPYRPRIQYNLFSKKTGKGGRQGERVYNIDSVGITICASSGGIGSKTGLYEINGRIRKLDLQEVKAMFGFPFSYNFTDVKSENAIAYLGNSIVVNVIKSFVPRLEEYFA